MIPTDRPPTTPGEVLREEFLVPLKLTQADCALRLGVAKETLNRMLNAKSGVSVEMAIRLAKVCGTTEHFWLNLQNNRSLYDAREKLAEELEQLHLHPGLKSA